MPSRWWRQKIVYEYVAWPIIHLRALHMLRARPQLTPPTPASERTIKLRNRATPLPSNDTRTIKLEGGSGRFSFPGVISSFRLYGSRRSSLRLFSCHFVRLFIVYRENKMTKERTRAPTQFHWKRSVSFVLRIQNVNFYWIKADTEGGAAFCACRNDLVFPGMLSELRHFSRNRKQAKTWELMVKL